jgi:PAS domain S-box-containing protein
MPQIVWVTRPDGWHIDFNQRWMDFTGLTLEESLGFGWNAPFHPDDRPRAAKLWEQATASGEPYQIEYRLRRADGSYRWMLGRALPLRDVTGKIVKWFGTLTDIHDIKQAEEELRASEERFQSIVANVPGMVYQLIRHPDGTVEWPFISGGSRELFHLEPEAIQGHPTLPLETVHPDDLPGFERSIAVSAQSLTPWNWEGRRLLPEGGVQWIQAISRPQRLPDGGTLWNGLVMDTTARKAAETERDRFFTLSLDLLGIANSNGYFRRLNPAFEETLGFSNEELMAAPFLEFVHPDDRAATLAEMEKIRSGETTFQFENRYRCRDGSYKWLQWMTQPFEDLWYFAARDITEHKQAEEDLRRQAEELARSNDELDRFNRAAVGRELRMIELKQQLNELSRQLGRPRPYKLDFLAEASPPVARKEKQGSGDDDES